MDVAEVVDAIGRESVGKDWYVDFVRKVAERFQPLMDELERLRVAYDEATEARIEAQNPGIDMDEVRRERHQCRASSWTGDVLVHQPFGPGGYNRCVLPADGHQQHRDAFGVLFREHRRP